MNPHESTSCRDEASVLLARWLATENAQLTIMSGQDLFQFPGLGIAMQLKAT